MRVEVTTRTGVARTFAEVAPVIARDEWKRTAVIRRENTLTYLPEENQSGNCSASMLIRFIRLLRNFLI